MTTTHRSIKGILDNIARNPNIDPGFKRGVSMLLESAGGKAWAEHHETIHLSDADANARRAHLDEIATLQEAFTAYRDECARLCTYWGVDAAALEDMTGWGADLASELLGKVRKEYGR